MKAAAAEVAASEVAAATAARNESRMPQYSAQPLPAPAAHAATRPVAPAVHAAPRPIAEASAAAPRPVAPAVHAGPRPVAHGAPGPVAAASAPTPRPVAPAVHAAPRPIAEASAAAPRPVAPAVHAAPRPIAEASAAAPRPIAEPLLSLVPDADMDDELKAMLMEIGLAADLNDEAPGVRSPRSPRSPRSSVSSAHSVGSQESSRSSVQTADGAFVDEDDDASTVHGGADDASTFGQGGDLLDSEEEEQSSQSVVRSPTATGPESSQGNMKDLLKELKVHPRLLEQTVQEMGDEAKKRNAARTLQGKFRKGQQEAEAERIAKRKMEAAERIAKFYRTKKNQQDPEPTKQKAWYAEPWAIVMEAFLGLGLVAGLGFGGYKLLNKNDHSAKGYTALSKSAVFDQGDDDDMFEQGDDMIDSAQDYDIERASVRSKPSVNIDDANYAAIWSK